MKLWKPTKGPGFISRHIAILKAAGIEVREKIPANKRKAAQAAARHMNKVKRRKQ